MRTVSLSKNLAAGSVNCIGLAQTKGAAGALVLNGGSVSGGVATLDTQRRIAIISDGNDSGITATIYGTRGSGQAINETLALANAGTAVSVLDYLTTGTISVSGAVANHVTIGTCGTGSTDWIMPNFHLTPFEVDINAQVTNTVTYNVETTLDDFWTVANPTTQPRVLTVVQAATAAQQTDLVSAVTGYRYTITNGTGTLTAQSDQAGIVNY